MTSPQPRQNRLAREKSPYLLQHASNPVDWWPWGPGAFREAERLERPIFLSIGYSSCHWCHVMEHESFADAEVAKVLNDHFVCIKVDREERPDIDEVYMTAVTAMGVGGGWPLSVWLTADGKPFTGGTYFPKEDRWGRPGFLRVLNAIAERWTDPSRREELKNHGRQVADFVRQSYEVAGRDSLGPEALATARQSLGAYYDPEYGGFGQQPKFPSPTTIEMVLRYAVGHKDVQALEMAENTLEKMARGGIHDHVGGGFHRYSVTRDWLIPHFEKMLYDNAQLLGTYAWAHLATGKEIYAETARDIARWVRREMTHPSGGFFSAQDADDPGGPEGEGGFYVWTPAEIAAVLPEEQAKAATLWFDVADPGNWHEKPGRSILQRPLTLEEAASRLGVSARRLADLLDEAREGLYRAREKRPKPMTDTKILADWNGLMISGLCRAWQALGDEEFLAAALAAGNFIRREMMRDGRIVRRWRDGDAMHEGVLDDYAFVVAAFLDLYESCFDAGWLREAFRLHALAIDLFHDADRGGYFHTPRDGEPLIARSKSGYDQARPSGNGVMAMNDLRIGEMTGDEAPRRRAQAAIDAFGARAAQSAIGFSALMNALDFAHAATREIFVAGEWSDPRTQALVRAVWRNPDTNRVIALATPEIGKILPPAAGKPPVNGTPAAYVCRGYVCETPVTDPAQLK